MNDKLITLIALIAAVVLAVASLFLWLKNDGIVVLNQRLPGDDAKPDLSVIGTPEVKIGQFFAKSGEDIVTEKSEAWPNFRGAYNDNIYDSTIKFADKWGDGGPGILWSVDLGEGHAGAAVKDGKVYVLDYQEKERSDTLRCISLKTGKEIWRRWYKIKIKRNHGISRTIPAVTDKYVVTFGPKCQIMCVDKESGDMVWGIDLEREYESKVPLWYAGQCPLIDGDQVILAPVGKDVLMMGVDIKSGEVLWKIPKDEIWEMSHSSIIPMRLAGRKMYVYSATKGGIVGVAADGVDRGTLLWKCTEWNHSVVAPSPVKITDDKVYITGGYGAGSMVIKIEESDGKYIATPVQTLEPKDGMASEQQTAIVYDGHLFGIQPKDAGALRQQFVCYKADDLSKLVWSSGKEKRFGLGPFVIADGKIYILSDEGVLTMIKLSTEKYTELDEYHILEGHDAWGPLAIVDGLMILRDSRKMICIDLKKK
jgi:outer membrane protein assembly factor BamB